MVMLSIKVASSRHRASLASDGRPANRSSTDPMMVCCSSERLIEGTVWIFLDSMFRVELDGTPAADGQNFDRR